MAIFDLDSQVSEFIVWGVLVVIATAVSFAVAALRRRVGARVGQSWDAVQGTIEHADVAVENRGKLSVYVAHLSYSYKVDGEYYAGAFTKEFLREQKADDFVASLPGGTPVTIRCKPRHAERSVLREDDNTSMMQARGAGAR